MPRQITTYADLQALVRDQPPRAALILGSGLSDLADRLDDAVELPFGGVPGMNASSVPGHRGVLLHGRWAGVNVSVFAGRLHYYEGHPWRTVVQPVHIAHELGASILIATNAAGGIRDDLRPGDLMAIKAHHDCTRKNWWRAFLPSPHRGRGAGGEGERVTANAAPSPPTPLPQGERGADYSQRLLDLLPLPRGVYAQLTGPCYETPAEIRALRTLGADAVGMSTGREIETGHALGMECAAISCITNKAAGLGSGPIHHEEVLETGRTLKSRLLQVLEDLIVRSVKP